MKTNIMNTKYIWMLLICLGFVACNDPEDYIDDPIVPDVVLPPLTAGSADFSNYVALGGSLTSGLADGALFIAGQQNSFPNILADQFSSAGGSSFSQPLVSDNTGGLLVGGFQVAGYRFIFNGEGPQRLNEFLQDLGAPVPPITTDAANNLGNIFNNVGIPQAKSFHTTVAGYGSLNPYFGRMATSAGDSMLGYAAAQNPSFFSIEIGGNDVLAYALSGGEGVDQTGNFNPALYGANDITDPNVFGQVFSGLVAQLTANGAKGAVTNVPNITDLPHFTTITFDYLDPADSDIGPLLIPQIPALNAQLYGPLDNIFTAYGEPDRFNLLSTTNKNPILIYDEDAIDRSAEITGALTPVLGAPTAAAFGAIFGKSRQTNANDLILLSTSSVLAQTVAGPPAPVNVNGISYPLADKWVLTPQEQTAIQNATDAYNATIASVASANGLAHVDLQSILSQASTTGLPFDEYVVTTDLVTGGIVSLDGVHFTARGYAFMANKFLEAIDTTYGSNFVASGNVTKAIDYNVTYSPGL